MAKSAPAKPKAKASGKPAETQADIARRALETKEANAPPRTYLDEQEPTAGDGPLPGVNRQDPVAGALDAEGQRPVLERSRKVR